MYERRKQKRGGQIPHKGRRNFCTSLEKGRTREKRRRKNELRCNFCTTVKGRTREILAKELGTSQRTIHRDAEFARAVNWYNNSYNRAKNYFPHFRGQEWGKLAKNPKDLLYRRLYIEKAFFLNMFKSVITFCRR